MKKPVKKVASKSAGKSASKSAPKKATKRPALKTKTGAAKLTSMKKMGTTGKVGKSMGTKSVVAKSVGAKSTATKTKVGSKAKTMTSSSPAKSSGKMNFKNFLSPLENRLFVKLSEGGEKMTTSGLYIPDTAQWNDGYIRGEVLAVGPGRKDRFGKLHPVGVDVGEIVLLTEHAGTQVVLEGQNFVFVRESDIVGVVE